MSNDPPEPDAARTDPGPPASAAQSAGRRASAKTLFERVYAQLRRVAEERLAGERRDHTLQATALVHEAYLRLTGGAPVQWAGQAHYFAAAAEAMRRILVEHARAKRRLKRGGDRDRPCGPISAAGLGIADLTAAEENPEDFLALDDAIRRMETDEPDLAGVVRLRFFAGLTVDETAAALNLSPRTVDERWKYARAWLFRAVNGTKERGT